MRSSCAASSRSWSRSRFSSSRASAVVVGPNGSGKSNVADAIVWASGSLAPHELRAEKPDDVLFAGSRTRKRRSTARSSCSSTTVPATGRSSGREVAIARRLQRGGEGQYLVNKAPVRRIDLVELLADVGLGGGMHSIIGQGKVEEILGSKASERRVLLEEAAGLGKFKARRHRAELKLARVATQVERARDVEEEVRKRLRPLALQASAAERAEKLGFELGRLRARIARWTSRRTRRGAPRRRSGGRRSRSRGGTWTRSSRRCLPSGTGRGRAGGRRRQARGGDRRALPAAERSRAGRHCGVNPRTGCCRGFTPSSRRRED